MSKDFVNDLAFTATPVAIQDDDVVVVKIKSKSLKHSDVPYSDFKNAVSSNSYVQISATYTVLNTDSTVECTVNSFTVTLPTAVGIEGKVFNIANTGAGEITLEGDGSETINGDLNQTIYSDESFQVQSNGSNFIVI